MKLFVTIVAIIVLNCSAWGRCPGAISVPAQRVAQLQRLFPAPPVTAREPKKTQFRAYADVTIPDRQLRFVLYSYNSPPPNQYSDAIYSVLLAVLSGAAGTERLESNSDITKQMPISTEEEDPGSVSQFDGCVTPFAAPGTQMLHVNLWSMISGNGAHNAASDIFYRLDDELQLRPVLKLEQTSRWGRMGADNAWRVDSTIAIVSASFGSPLTVLGQFRTNNTEDGKPVVWSEQRTYRWNGTRFENPASISSQQFANLMKRAHVLARSNKIPSADSSAQDASRK